MLNTNNPIIKHKAGLLNLVEELGNVSRECKVMDVSRDTFYLIFRTCFKECRKLDLLTLVRLSVNSPQVGVETSHL